QTPEPSAGVLLVIGSVATFVLGRRKKA
ncbi:MAG: PEP-CTERM sorting domain-containing protein, partial [Proteobacteria bacterium]|nr:PEP-CTERM sorting domain-containing protein [Pseudomonadota bacterium]